jgi:hypothetical protein
MRPAVAAEVNAAQVQLPVRAREQQEYDGQPCRGKNRYQGDQQAAHGAELPACRYFDAFG